MTQVSQLPSDASWWVKVDTALPRCTYFFGPFESSGEAQLHRPGYFDDLFDEGAQGIEIAIEQDEPQVLTLFEDETLPFVSAFKPSSVRRSSLPIAS